MKWRTVFFLLVAASVAAGAWGWRRAAQAERELQGLAFVRQRADFLQAENDRLARLLADRQAAESQQEDQRLRGEIEKQVADISGRSFVQPVRFREIPHAELPAILGEKLARQVPDTEFAKVGLELSALGLIPAGMDLKKVYLDLLGEQVGAFYDQHTHELFTFSGHPLTDAQNRVVLAHELTHALQDQHFDLSSLPLEVRGNDDEALAASALVEGDATVVMNQYLLTNMTAAALRDSIAGAVSTDVRQLAAAPRYLRETLLFPYLRGQEFVTEIRHHGGNAAVTAAFRDPPNSTAEILHPERYLAVPRRQPVRFLGDAPTLLGRPPAVDNVLGEFTARQIFQLWDQDRPHAEQVAAGWTGDRVIVYGTPTAYSYLWVGAWRDSAAATAFARLARAEMAARATPSAQSSDAGRSSRSTRFDQSGHITALIDAQNELWANALSKLASQISPDDLP